MDATSYKDFKTSRGVNYHYFFSKAQGNKPTLLFLHGFPSTSIDWKLQVPFFKKEGYGLIIPDLLGYGGTDRPTDVNAYRMSLMNKDVIDIMDHENIPKAIVIGHDWGCFFTGKLANNHSDRFLAFAFLALTYMPPAPDFDIHAVLKENKEKLGNEIFGYWLFFGEDGADQIVKDHFESWFSLGSTSKPELWTEHICPVGAMKAWLLADKMAPIASYADEEYKQERREIVMSGLNGGFNWYKAMLQKVNAEDDAKIPKEAYIIKKPVFFGAALQDLVCLAEPGKEMTKQFCPNATIVDIDAGHFVQFAAPNETNNALLKWIQSLQV